MSETSVLYVQEEFMRGLLFVITQSTKIILSTTGQLYLYSFSLAGRMSKGTA